MRSETRRLPKDHSHVLTSTQLDEALGTAGIAIDTHLIRDSGPALDAHFWPPTPDVPYERLYVRAGAVPRIRVAEVRGFIEGQALPGLVRWLADILSRDVASPVRREKQYWQVTLP